MTVGCEKTYTNCNYYITPYREAFEDSTLQIADSVIGYAYYADTARWAVTSYDNAVAGILTSKYDGAPRQPDVVAEQDSIGRIVFPNLKKSPLIMILCDRQDSIYAWRQSEIMENLPQVIVKMTFQPWRTDTTYLYAKWNMVNETPPLPAPPDEEEGEGEDSGDTE